MPAPEIVKVIADGPQGAVGASGSPGASATVAVGAVSTGAAGSNAIVTNSGSSSAAIFNFIIPRGDTGATGPSGTPGPSGATGVVAATFPIIYSSGTQTVGIIAATASGDGSMSAADKTKLDGVASGATANSPDATLLDRANHTGTQAGSTITGAYTAAGMTMATARLLGRSTAGSGAAEEVAIGSGLVFSGGTLTAIATGSGGSGTPGGSTTQVQFNDAGAFAGDADLTWNKTTNVLGITGDVNLSDGGTYTTTLQTITPTAARTISFPDATGTVALVGGSSGNLTFNNAGAYAGVANSSVDNATGNITLGSRFISSLNGAASAPPGAFTGTWFTGGTATTTKPQVLIEPTGTTSTTWSTSGTGLGVNASSGFAGNLLDLQVNGTRVFGFTAAGIFGFASASIRNPTSNTLEIGNAAGSQLFYRFLSTTGSVWSNSAYFGWSSTAESTGSVDLTLFRDAADTLAQRRTTNAQTFRCYGTFTDTSNYVRAALSSTSTAVTLAAETAGTGADNIPLNLTAAGTGTIKVNSVAEVVVSSTVAGLPAAPVVGMLTRVTDATAPVVGTTVAGGGAAAALCWYNGASWSVIGV